MNYLIICKVLGDLKDPMGSMGMFRGPRGSREEYHCVI